MSKNTAKKQNTVNAIKEAVAKQKQSAKQTTTAKKQSAKAEQKQSVTDVMTEHIKALQNIEAYRFVSDIDAKADNADANARNDYMHVFRHDTTATVHAHNNVAQCYYKHSKEQIYVLVNRANFTDFATEIEHKDVKTSLIRYYVAYSDFTAFMTALTEYDMNRRKATATATEQKTTERKAK